MNFTKMQGCGNDYIYINCFEEKVANPEALAIRLSDRNFGIGGDGIILIKPSDKADFFMDMYNLDGSRGRMCGNAIRCVGKYVFDHGMTDQESIDIETLSGIKHLQLHVGPDSKIDTVTVDMGSPCTVLSEIPVVLPTGNPAGISAEISAGNPAGISAKIPAGISAGIPAEIPAGISAGISVQASDFAESAGYDCSSSVDSMASPEVVRMYPLTTDDGLTYPFTFVSMGNPHAVTFVDSPADLPLNTIGPKYEFHKAFPERANIEFVHVTDRTHIDFRVWERGSGETKACGTGACASVYASILNGFTDDEVHASMLGGELVIRYDRALNRIFMTGPAVEVFAGTINLPDR